jgi:hypothetical protein
MLGVEGTLAWSQDEAGLHIDTPAQKPGDHAYTFKLRLKA